jgi:hypothetical protein
MHALTPSASPPRPRPPPEAFRSAPPAESSPLGEGRQVDRRHVAFVKTRLFAAATLGAAVLAAGCGSSDEPTTTSAEKWAGGVCGAVTTYVDAIKQAAGTFKSNPTSSGLDQARTQAKSATESFKATLEGLGRPDTTSGKQAKQAVDSLASQLSQDAEKVRAATEAVNGTEGVMNAVSVVTGALATAKTQITTTVDELRSLEHGELADAFAGADSCTALTRA